MAAASGGEERAGLEKVSDRGAKPLVVVEVDVEVEVEDPAAGGGAMEGASARSRSGGVGEGMGKGVREVCACVDGGSVFATDLLSSYLMQVGAVGVSAYRPLVVGSFLPLTRCCCCSLLASSMPLSLCAHAHTHRAHARAHAHTHTIQTPTHTHARTTEHRSLQPHSATHNHSNEWSTHSPAPPKHNSKPRCRRTHVSINLCALPSSVRFTSPSSSCFFMLLHPQYHSEGFTAWCHCVNVCACVSGVS